MGGVSSADAALKLEKLRTDPERTATEYGFIVAGVGNYAGRTEGGPCTVECENLGDGNYALRPVGGSGSDFFFPYVSFGVAEGIGQCAVPLGQPNGTIVITGGMNGCSLEVRRLRNSLVFMHDADGKAFSKLPGDSPLRAGERVCHVEAKHYMVGPLQQNHAIARMEELRPLQSGVAAAPENYLISVKAGGRWKVLHSPMLRITTASRDGAKNRFERGRAVSNVMTSFDE